MKKILITLVLALIVNLSKAQYRKILSVLQFDNLENRVKDDYGSKSNPVESGAFINFSDDKARRAAMLKLYNSYRWPNGDKIDFSKRHSTRGYGSKDIVDVYTLINPETKDSLLLYVDPYKASEKYYVPKGLTPLTATMLKPQVEPILEQIQEINKADDGVALKLHAGDILRYLSANFDQNVLIDQERLKFLLEDKDADKSLTGFLMRSYIFNKFYALAKDVENEKDYAFEQLKASYKSYMKAHPETSKGKLEEYLK
ncbi:MAG: hypothetical protein ACO1N4_00995 [Pedobacter sp.]